MKQWLTAAAIAGTLGCTPAAEPQAAPAPPVSPPAPESSKPAAEPQAAPEPTRSDEPPPLPPLSSPNEKPVPRSSAEPAPAEEPGIPHVDPRQTALRRAGESAQSCYAQAGLPTGTAGKLFVRITLAADGSVARAEVDRRQSTATLVGGKLEECVLAAVRKQSFPAPRSGTDVTLEMPLDFRPPN
jgi:hypothetical protein